MLTDTNNILSMDKLPPVILLFGEEEYLAELAFRKIVNRAAGNEDDKYEFTGIDAEDKEITLSKVVDLCSSYSMLGGKTLVAVKNFEKLFPSKIKKDKAKKTAFYKYLEDPNPQNLLLIRTSDTAVQGFGRKLYKSKSSTEKYISNLKFPYNVIIENYPSVEFPKIWENKMPDWIISEFQNKKRRIDREAAEYLLAQSNPDLRTIHNEIEKIDIYLENKEHITIDDISRLVGASRSFNVFELQKAIGNRDIERSILILKNMLAESSSEMLIIVMLTRYFKKVWELDERIGSISNKFQLAGKLGISPVFIEDYKVALRKYNKEELVRVFNVLADTDEQLKTSGYDKYTIMQNMIVKLTKTAG